MKVETERQSAGSEQASGFRGDIQGMRALAVMVVVLYHAGVPGVTGGFVGVDVFFVISGFLITLHLAKELGTTGGVALLPFYARRIRRLLPAAWLVIIVSLVAARLFAWPLQQAEVAKGALTSSSYLINVWLAFTQTDYLAGETPNLFQHYWSLAVEEQFYLVWPLLLVLSIKVWPRRGLAMVPALVVAASFALGVYLTGVAQPWSFFSLPTRLWELGSGGLVAILLYQGWLVRVRRLAGVILAGSGLTMILVVVFSYTHDTTFPGLAAVVPVLGAALLIAGGASANPVSGFLSWAPFQYVGRISYALYLWHWPILVIPQLRGIELSPFQIAASCLLAAALADATERWVERPTRFWSGWVRPRRSVVLAMAGTAVCIVLAGASLLIAPKIQHGPPVAKTTSTQVAQTSGTNRLPSNVSPDLRAVSASIPDSYGTGCHVGVGGSAVPEGCIYGGEGPRVALFGDSHGAQFQPALAQLADNGDLSLLTATKSACPSVGIPVSYRGRDYDACKAYRKDALGKIADFDADFVVVSNSYFTDAGGARTDKAVWRKALNELADAVEPARVVLVTDGPRFQGISPAECASGHSMDLAQCQGTSDDFNLGLERTETRWAESREGADVVNLRQILCGPGGGCPVVKGNTFVYRDTHHLTTQFAELLAPTFKKHIDQPRES